MRKETKIISILSSAIFSISALFLLVPDILRFNSDSNYEAREDEFSDLYWENTAYMKGFGSATSTISFEGELDKEMFEYLKNIYTKFKYLDNLGSDSESGSGYINVYDINMTALNEQVEVNKELYTILSESKKLFEYSEGIFDITSGHIFNEVDDFIKENDPLDIDEYLVGFNVDFDDRLLLEEVDGKYFATRTNEHTNIQLGGYLKGYFTEYARSQADLAFNNDREIFISSGGSSMTYIGSGDKNITIGTPRQGEEHPGRWINQNNYHLATSGDEAQYRCVNTDFINNPHCLNDEIIHHLVDPRDGTFRQDRGRAAAITNEFAPFMDAISSILFIADINEMGKIMSNFTEYEIDYMYTVIEPNSNEFKVYHVAASEEVKWEFSPEYITEDGGD